MPHTYIIHHLIDDDTEIEVSGTVRKNPYYTRIIYADHYTPDEEPYDIEITSELPNAITNIQIEEIEEKLFQAYAEDGEDYPQYRTNFL